MEKSLRNNYVDLSVSENNIYINVSKIVIAKEYRNQGIGTQIMNEIINYANQHNKIITLTPSNSFGGNIGKLRKFYKDLGFVNNKGKNKDFRTSESFIKINT